MNQFFRFRQTAGFTLLEIVIAIAILSFGISIMYLLYTSVISIADDTGKRIRLDRSGQMVLSRLAHDLKSINTGKVTVLDGKGVSSVVAGEPFLTVLSTAHVVLDPEAPPVDVTLVRYYLEENNETGCFTLLRSDNPVFGMVDMDRDVGESRHVLSQCALGLEILYVDHNREELELWNSESKRLAGSSGKEILPLAFKILLQLGEPGEDKTAQYELLIPVPKAVTEFEVRQ